MYQYDTDFYGIGFALSIIIKSFKADTFRRANIILNKILNLGLIITGIPIGWCLTNHFFWRMTDHSKE